MKKVKKYDKKQKGRKRTVSSVIEIDFSLDMVMTATYIVRVDRK